MEIYELSVTCDDKDCEKKISSRFATSVPEDVAKSIFLGELEALGWCVDGYGDVLCPNHC